MIFTSPSNFLINLPLLSSLRNLIFLNQFLEEFGKNFETYNPDNYFVHKRAFTDSQDEKCSKHHFRLFDTKSYSKILLKTSYEQKKALRCKRYVNYLKPLQGCSACHAGYFLHPKIITENEEKVAQKARTRHQAAAHFNTVKACEKCHTGCQSCSSIETCSQCQSSFFKGDNQKCQQCPLGCQECIHAHHCVKCLPGFKISDSTALVGCSQCPKDCSKCSDSSSCLECSKGFGMDPGSGECLPCGQNCEVCLKNRFGCEKCKSGYRLSESEKPDERGIWKVHPPTCNLDFFNSKVVFVLMAGFCFLAFSCCAFKTFLRS